jgi:hypothetical protein
MEVGYIFFKWDEKDSVTNSFMNSNNNTHLHDRQNPWLELQVFDFVSTEFIN